MKPTLFTSGIIGLALLIIGFACVVQAVNYYLFHYPAWVGFPIAVGLALATYKLLNR